MWAEESEATWNQTSSSRAYLINTSSAIPACQIRASKRGGRGLTLDLMRMEV